MIQDALKDGDANSVESSIYSSQMMSLIKQIEDAEQDLVDEIDVSRLLW